MKKLILPLATLACTSILAFPATAQVDVTSSLFYGSPYVWRGEVLSNGFVLQPYVEASYQGFALSFFGNVDPNGGGDQRTMSVNEADLTVSYAASLGGVDAGVGYTLYTFPGYAEDELELSHTQEVFGSVSLVNLAVTPSLLVAYDFDSMDGLYAELGLGYEIFSGSQPIGLGLALGFDHAYVLPDGESALSHASLTASTGFAAGGITISPMAGFQLSLDDSYQGAFGETIFYGGIGIEF